MPAAEAGTPRAAGRPVASCLWLPPADSRTITPRYIDTRYSRVIYPPQQPRIQWCQRWCHTRTARSGYNPNVMTRRLGGLIVGALVLHLGFVAQDATCLASSPGPHSHHFSGSHKSSAPGQQPHTAPSLPVCCQALTSCSPTIALGREVSKLTSIAVRARPVISPLDPTTSRTTAPEAPPPRA